MSSFAIGVDLGGTNLRISAVDEHGRQLETITTGTEVARGRDVVIGEMCNAILALSGKFQSKGTLLGIGVGVPGLVDLDTGMLRQSPNLPGWHDYPVKAEIERRIHAPVVLENDANAAALGEKWLGAGKDVDSLCMITMGTGVGGGIILDGSIWHGMTGMAGELGHVTVNPEGPPCPCGNRGCLEQYASATAIKRMAIEGIATGKAPDLARAMSESPEFSAKVVHQMASNGDATAQKIFDSVGRALGIAVANYINIFNLPMYVIGGGASSGWDAFSPALHEEVEARSFVYKVTKPEAALPARGRTMINRAMLGSEAGLIGAAYLGIKLGGSKSGDQDRGDQNRADQTPKQVAGTQN